MIDPWLDECASFVCVVCVVLRGPSPFQNATALITITSTLEYPVFDPSV
jgi:hypothetical protein